MIVSSYLKKIEKEKSETKGIECENEYDKSRVQRADVALFILNRKLLVQ